MNRSKLQSMFPNASEAFLTANATDVAAETVVQVRAKVSVNPSTDISKLNKLETSYHLLLQSDPTVVWIGVQSVTLKLGNDCRYTPDFVTISDEGIVVAHECKGFFRDDAKVKIKVAAHKFRWITFLVSRKIKGAWDIAEVKP